jgi:hypothetical protein
MLLSTVNATCTDVHSNRGNHHSMDHTVHPSMSCTDDDAEFGFLEDLHHYSTLNPDAEMAVSIIPRLSIVPHTATRHTQRQISEASAVAADQGPSLRDDAR